MPIDNEKLAIRRESLHEEIKQLRNTLNEKETLFARLDKIVQKKVTVLEDPEDPQTEKEETAPIMDSDTGAEMTETRRQEILDELAKADPELAA